ncbi:MAG TPA: hypothetical protein VF450_01215 [Noviherbaspirillum sp.]|jgi:hypothetical protein
MNTKVSTQPSSLLPFLHRWFAAVVARWNERIDRTPMPTHRRMGSWEASVRGKRRE